MMVMGYDEERLLLVLQIDHSRVAGLLAAHWGNDQFERPRPYSSMVLAAQEHDNGWYDWEIRPTLSREGHPVDYIGSMGHMGNRWLDFQRGGVERVAAQDPYAGYIASMHISGLLNQGMGLLPYMPDYTGNQDVETYLQEQTQYRQGLLQEIRSTDETAEEATDEHLWNNFKLMEVYDQMAQFVCNRYPFNNTERKNGPSPALSGTPAPTLAGKDDVGMALEIQDENHAIVRPYPFDVDPLEISFQGRLVPRGPYASRDDFLGEFYSGERIGIRYTLCSG